jgi:uncharacterized membrane protein YczE
VIDARLPGRVATCAIGCVAFGWGIALMIGSHAGIAPWDVLHYGIAGPLHVSFGVAGAIVGVGIAGVAWLLGRRPGWGTAMNIVLITPAADVALRLHLVPDSAGCGLPRRLAENVAGILVIGLSSGLYIGAGRSAGPRDSLMLAVSDHTGWRVAISRNLQEVVALAVGIALGGAGHDRLGVGTALFALGVGPAVELGFWSVGAVERARRGRR